MPDLANLSMATTGLDSLLHCKDKRHFLNFPSKIDYRYNSRGFRDKEWPDDLDQAIWCVGDSFTVGLGLPFDLIWSQQLQTHTNRPVISIAMDGASNQWISRMAKNIISDADPFALIIMWSYANRRELSDDRLPDMKRRQHHDMHFDIAADYDLFEKSVTDLAGSRLVHSVVPNFHKMQDIALIWDQVKGPDWPKDLPNNFQDLSSEIRHELLVFHDLSDIEVLIDLHHRFQSLKKSYTFVEYEVVDLARDGHHLGPETCRLLGEKFARIIGMP